MGKNTYDNNYNEGNFHLYLIIIKIIIIIIIDEVSQKMTKEKMMINSR